MKINPVKQFVKSNIARFEKNVDGRNWGHNKSFNLYDKNNTYRGEYMLRAIHSNDYHGVKTSMSVTRIMSEKLKQQMQEIVYIQKRFVTFKAPETEDLTKVLPLEITTTSTVLDYASDRYNTVRTVSKLKNKLHIISKYDPDFIYSENHIIYEPLKEKPEYEKSVEYEIEGSISEKNKNINIRRTGYHPNGSINQIPYKYWG